MDKNQIWSVLECCLLVTDGANFDYLIRMGFDSIIAKAGIKLFYYLEGIKLNNNDSKNDI